MQAPLSRPARWRIATLALVHCLIAAHIIHWKLAGTSLSSIQLSDAGRFAAEGVATAALLLFALLLVVTAIFGRFFCAWGCHMLALQELCRFLLGRVGIRPKLIRSRLLPLVPVYAAFYIFFQPVFERWWSGVAFPNPQLELLTDNVWANLPGPATAAASIIVGGLTLVYLLGALSFCKYVCPYGALFAAATRVAPGRIRLIGECDGCARCTAACTTGVIVHEEVQRAAMVADSGCMRCFECVSACPRRVLAYRFGRPRLTAGSSPEARGYAFSLGEECGLLLLSGISFFALHGLYDAFPLLLSLAVSVVLAYLGVLTVRLARQPFVALRGLSLKQAGALSRAGVIFAACAAIMFSGVGHSLLIQSRQRRAAAILSELDFPRLRTPRPPREQQLARAAAADLAFCSRYGVVDTADWHMKLAWVSRLLSEPQLVETHLRRAITLDPTQPAAHFNLGKELSRQGRSAEAAQAFREAVRLAPWLAQHQPTNSSEARMAN